MENASDANPKNEVKVAEVDNSRMPLFCLDSTDSKTRRFIIILPQLEFPIFGGVATAIKIACSLVEQCEQVVICTMNKPIDTTSIDLQDTSKYLGVNLNILCDLINSAQSMQIKLRNSDFVIATAWWTLEATLNFKNLQRLESLKIFYLVQDYEPLFYPASEEYARALQTYSHENITLIFNSTSLAEFFSNNVGISSSESFVLEPQHLFSPVSNKVASRHQKQRDLVKIFYYARPSTPRNLFEIGVKAIDCFLERYGDDRPFEIVTAGESHPEINLRSNYTIRSLGVLNYSNYERTLEESDIGLSLMLSPHPSYPPLEMLAKGLYVVTNDFLGSKSKYLQHQNLWVMNPDIDDLARGLNSALESLLDTNSDLRVSSKWNLGNDLGSLCRFLIQIANKHS